MPPPPPQPTGLRVLFVEDSPDDAELVSLELARHGFRCESRVVESHAAFQAALQDSRWDIVLCDHSMKQFSSLDALNLARAHDPDLPFIVVSGTIGEDAAVESMRAGAQDYVLKHNLRRLGPAVAREIREAENRRRQRRTQAALQSSENRLRHAQKLEAVGRLAGGIAHDFNNLLTVILGFSETLVERLPPHGAPHREASQIQVAAERATRLTRQLLAFSRQQVLDPRVVDLASTIRNLQPMVERLIGEDVRCEFALPSTPLRALIDPGQFEQVVINLVINARDAMPAGGQMKLELSAAAIHQARATALDVEPGEFVELRVTDTGVGMPAQIVEQIFEPFFTTKLPGHGTGLGLSTVFGIVRQSHGAVDVTSEPEKGSTFRIYLPISEAADKTPDIRPPQFPAPAPGVTILLAEDEEGVREFLQVALERGGHTVIPVADGAAAVSAARASAVPIHLLITDVVMPSLSGPDVAAKVAELFPDLRVIFLSGYSSHSALPDDLADAGAFLQKPFTIGTLLAKVQERLAT